jgi:hypothetical protein
MPNQIELLRELQKKSEELGISKGDLVQLGTLAICRTSNQKIMEVISKLSVSPVRCAS